MTKKETAATQKEDARIFLRGLVEPGDQIYLVKTHEGTSTVAYSVYIAGTVGLLEITDKAAIAMGDKLHRSGGIPLSGYGYSKSFHLGYALGRALFPDGFRCIGDRLLCNGNEHCNDHAPYSAETWHKDGGYALSVRVL